MRAKIALITIFALFPNVGFAEYDKFREMDVKPPVIFVPGIMGSKLREVGRIRNIWGTLLGANRENFKKIILDPQNEDQREIEAYEILDDFDMFPLPW